MKSVRAKRGRASPSTGGSARPASSRQGRAATDELVTESAPVLIIGDAFGSLWNGAGALPAGSGRGVVHAGSSAEAYARLTAQAHSAVVADPEFLARDLTGMKVLKLLSSQLAGGCSVQWARKCNSGT